MPILEENAWRQWCPKVHVNTIAASQVCHVTDFSGHSCGSLRVVQRQKIIAKLKPGGRKCTNVIRFGQRSPNTSHAVISTERDRTATPKAILGPVGRKRSCCFRSCPHISRPESSSREAPVRAQQAAIGTSTMTIVSAPCRAKGASGLPKYSAPQESAQSPTQPLRHEERGRVLR